MTTIFAVTSLRLNGLQRKKLLDAVEKLQTLFWTMSIYIFSHIALSLQLAGQSIR